MFRLATLIVILSCFGLCVSGQGARRKSPVKPSAAISTPSATPTPSSPPPVVPFDPSVTSLPPNFTGFDPVALHSALMNLISESKKSEFETTEAHRSRVNALKERPVTGKLTLDSIIAFPIPNAIPKYDADKQQMTITPQFYAFTLSERFKLDAHSSREYTAQNAFGATIKVTEIEGDEWRAVCKVPKGLADSTHPAFKGIRSLLSDTRSTFTLAMDSESAKQAKTTLRILAVIRLVEPWATEKVIASKATFDRPTATRLTSKQIACEVLEFWVYDSQSGRILEKRSPSQ